MPKNCGLRTPFDALLRKTGTKDTLRQSITRVKAVVAEYRDLVQRLKNMGPMDYSYTLKSDDKPAYAGKFNTPASNRGPDRGSTTFQETCEVCGHEDHITSTCRWRGHKLVNNTLKAFHNPDAATI